MAEFPNFGRHCAKDGCQLLDFLPVPCQHCQDDFCSIHASASAHSCSQAPNKIFEGPSDLPEVNVHFCSVELCRAKHSFPVLCPKCNENFCLQHRYPDDHSCVGTAKEAGEKRVLPPHLEKIKNDRISSVASDTANGVTSTSTKLVQLSSGGNQRANKLILMKLKMKAKGESMSEDERIYVSAIDPSGKETAVFVSKNWSIGRALDAIARLTKTKNENNLTGSKKLRLVCYNEPLDFARKVSDALPNGATVNLIYDDE